MVSGHWITRRAISLGLCLLGSVALAQTHTKACSKPLYLTIDTGHMGVAELMAQVLNKHHVKATFFAAQERTQTGDGSLGKDWSPWWRARAAEGHEFASHTYDHVYWLADLPGGRFRVRPTIGAEQNWDAMQYCAEIKRAADRLTKITGLPTLSLYRAPGGKTSPRLLAAAKSCGYVHVPWSPAGFLGDELPSEKFSNASLLTKALKDIREGDILLAHLGIWSRKDAWAPAVFEPLIVGLQAKGFCFQTMSQHPVYGKF